MVSSMSGSWEEEGPGCGCCGEETGAGCVAGRYCWGGCIQLISLLKQVWWWCLVEASWVLGSLDAVYCGGGFSFVFILIFVVWHIKG